MKHRLSLGITLAMCAAAEGAEPAASSAVLSAPVPSANTTAPLPSASAAKAATSNPLDLRVGDVRRYMMPSEYRAVLGAPDADADTVVVEGKRELLPMKSERPVPGGLIAPFWALAHPLQSWRIFVPDLKNQPAQDRPRDPEDKVPPREFRWGP